MKNIFNLLIAAGIILMIGTAGAADTEGISLLQIASRFCISGALIVLGVMLKKASACVKKYIVKKVIHEYEISSHAKTAF